ncbi:hypothetical protein, partial [Actinophytocola sp.]|uniref:hypothetical protein n=1 Tax=Actinophytocola sp. TaxID=1872138 RepID=UPI002EF2518B
PEPVTGPQSSGLLGGLLGTVTSTLNGLTHVVVNVAATVLDHSSFLAPIVLPPMGGSLPDLLPDLLPGLGAPADVTGTPRTGVVPVPAVPPATPALPATIGIAPEHTPRAAEGAVTPRTTSSRPGSAADRATDRTAEHADKPGPDQPVKAPAAPVAPGGTSVSSAHDNSGGARGTHGMLTAQATLRPSAAGFTTRSRAADATGRVAGLPAISPD